MENLKVKLEQVRKDKKLLEEEEKRIEQKIKKAELMKLKASEENIPVNLWVGQIYKITPSRGALTDNYMVVSVGNQGFAGLTCIGKNSGCFNDYILNGSVSKNVLRTILVKNNAEYLGTFNNIYQEKD